jgi:osmotically-inducible protein OsmY
MADESRWSGEGRFGLGDQERSRWNDWRNERDHGRFERTPGRPGREFGGSYGGYESEAPYGDYRGGGRRDQWRDPSREYGQFGYGRDYGAPYRGPGYGYGAGAMGSGPRYGRNPGQAQGQGQGGYEDRERGWFDRATDEVSSWFGDDEAARRRDMDASGPDRRGRGPKGYVRSDERIREDVCDRLCDDRLVDASEIDVAVAGSEVTLSGTVNTREERRRAEDCVEQVLGVTHVQNNLRVSNAGSTSMGGTNTTGRRGTPGMGRDETPPTGRAAH